VRIASTLVCQLILLSVFLADNVRAQESPNLVVPATVEIMDDSVVASGEIEIRHADIGLAPFTAFLGSIRVRDEIVLQYHIQADRILPQAN
jgi:hypothetical protein